LTLELNMNVRTKRRREINSAKVKAVLLRHYINPAVLKTLKTCYERPHKEEKAINEYPHKEEKKNQ